MNKTNFIWIILSFSCTYSHAEDSMDGNNRTKTVMQSYIVSAPCSIGTDSLYQNINIHYIANTKTEPSNINKNNRKPFNIKLNNCISEYDKEKHKGIKIKLQANPGTDSNTINLSSSTAGIILYDINNNLLTQNKSYSISDNAIYFNHETKVNFLAYEAEIETINNKNIPDNYFATIKFDISYD